MGTEVNIEAILALEKQIEEGFGDVTRLKRVRNSLLNISTRVPPELLGQVFHWNVIPEEEFGGLQKGSYNFLLVCHHWFEVASNTPELWAFWGHTIRQWSRRYQRSGTSPLDLVLSVNEIYAPTEDVTPFDENLRVALRDHAARNSIRSVHLRGWDTHPDQLRSIISSLTLDGEEIRDNCIESLIVKYRNLDISDFLARYRFPKLRNFCLTTSAGLSSWEHLKLHAPSLTTLSLEFTTKPHHITASQLLSILATYPNIRDLSLSGSIIPRGEGYGATFRLPMRRLKKLHLSGDLRCVSRLLHQLECPDALDKIHLCLARCVGEEVSEFFESCLRDRIRRDDRFQGGLEIYVAYGFNSISLDLNIHDESNIRMTPPVTAYPCMSFSMQFKHRLPRRAEERLSTNLLAAIPNIESLRLFESVVSDTFLRKDSESSSQPKLLPYLRSLCLDCVAPQNDDDWSPLVTYITHQTSGGQSISLRLCGEYPTLPPKVVSEIEDLVEEFNLGYCSDDEVEAQWMVQG